MTSRFRTLARTLTMAGIIAATSLTSQAQPGQAKLTGRVSDGSGGALPGVTVTIQAEAGPPVVVVSDDVGHYQSPPLPPGVYTVSFELAGFEARRSSGLELRAGMVFILDRELTLAAVKESVEVVAPAPPPPGEAPRFEPPRRPRVQPVPQEVLASVCGPGRPADADLSLGRIVAHRDDKHRTLFGDGDILLLDVGDDAGARIGDNYVVRRRFRIDDRSVPVKQASFGEQTAGLIQVVDTMPTSAIAVVVYTCGELYAGDTIEPFQPLPLVGAHPDHTPVFDDPARIIFGEHGQQMGATRQLMVIDRGTIQGVERGQRLTIFRRMHGERGPVSTIGNAVIIAVRDQSATIRIERASDAVLVGDLVALHR